MSIHWNIDLCSQKIILIVLSLRQNALVRDVPYSRLLDSPSKVKEQTESRTPTPTAGVVRQDSESKLSIPKSLKVPTPKTSASDSRLTGGDSFQSDESDIPTEMSHSAPQPNQLESDSDYSMSPRVTSEETIASRDVRIFFWNFFFYY